MNELLGRLTEFDEAEGSIRIVAAYWLADDMYISLSVQLHSNAEPELWAISCSGVIEESLSSEYSENFSISSASPLLKPYTEPKVALMFSENNCAPEFLLGVVCGSCIEIFGSAEYLSRFMNQAATVTGIVKSRYGQLGCFPESVASRILLKLVGQNIRINPLLGRMPQYWNGSEHTNYPALKVLECGNSYIIAERFSAVRA